MDVNVRSGDSPENSIVTVLKSGDKVEILDNTDFSNWPKIRFGVYEGYVNKDYLKKIRITSIKAGNVTINNEWINHPGETLYAQSIRFLKPVIMYDSAMSGKVIFYVKIIQPDGVIDRNPSESPVGYTNSAEVSVTKGESKSLNLSSWGTDNGGSYRRGQWTIEVWYEGVRLRSEKIMLN
jgi:uncharacterized protein YgiM (DUF1202 family)